jgi:N4-(beta-N-acetylglucosaminyl)-L-asparaginase
MRQGLSPQDACKEAVSRIVKKNPAKAKTIQVGFMALNKNGEFGAFCLLPGFNYAVQDAKGNRLIDGTSYFQS